MDLRSLAVFRIGVAAFTLWDLLSRSFDLTAHYTDAGVLPRVATLFYYAGSPVYDAWSPTNLSVHMLTGTRFGIGIIFLFQAIAALLLLVGYRTRLMTFICWFLLASLQARNPLVLSVGDDVLRVLLFFAIFLPLGMHYSIDSALNSGRAVLSEVYVSAATATYYLQFVCIYFFAALLKTGPEWRVNGTALYYAFNFDQFAQPFAKTLLSYPGMLRILTFAAWLLELIGPFVLLIPLAAAKLVGVLLFAVLQIGIGATLALGHNPWVNCIVLLPFLPSFLWRWQNKREPIEIIYDGDCGLCKKLVLILIELLRPNLNGPPRPAQGRDLATLRKENSWIVRTKAGEFYRFDAFLQLLSSTPLLFWAVLPARLKPVHFVGTLLYRSLANHRNPVAKLLSPLRFRPIELNNRSWWQAFPIFFFVGVLIYNASWLRPTRRLTSFMEMPTLMVRLEQYWGMFAPFPNKEDGWYVFEGILRNGSKVDVFTGREIRFEKPGSPYEFYPNERWRRYLINIGTRDLRDLRRPFAAYLCRTWNGSHSGSTHLDRGSVLFMQEVTPPPGEHGEVQKLNLNDYVCSQ